jgi:hypothetical protein
VAVPPCTPALLVLIPTLSAVLEAPWARLLTVPPLVAAPVVPAVVAPSVSVYPLVFGATLVTVRFWVAASFTW